MIFNKNTINTRSRQFIAVLILSFCYFSLLLNKVNAGELSAQIHSGTEENAIGYSFHFSDAFFSQRNFRWGLGYSHLAELKATWNDEEQFFNNDNVDAFVAYRLFPKSYNAFWRPFNFEFKAGASISLTENKFTFEKFPDQEIVFSEKNDVNFMLGFTANYQLSRASQVQLGYRYYPKFSEFDDQGSIFIGLSYEFGRKRNY
ncbi:MAG: hypothetical protein ACSHW0_16265 [Thalassotalea sp.]